MKTHILIISVLLSTISFSQMTEKTYGWAIYDDEASEFSESFKEQMSIQLEKRFNQFLKIDNVVSEKEFMLFVGQSDMKITYKDGFGFALVAVLSSGMYSNYLTAYWRLEDSTRIESATKLTSLDSSSIEFGWCADFDPKVFLKHVSSIQKLDTKKYNIAFEVEYDFNSYPDLSVEFKFKNEPSEKELEAIQNTVSSSLSRAYVSKISLADDKHYFIIDFQGQKYEEGTADLLELVKKLNGGDEKDIIELIRIK